MAQKKVYAPEGHHFMVNKQNGFYLMETASKGYKAHTINGEKSSLYVLIEVKDAHRTVARTNNSTYSRSENTTRRSSSGRATTPTIRNTTVPPSTSSSNTSSSGGGY
tara:strand:- start:1155 stop:1475 length:321 start_codon:yes stop_codon:yes gene_type:complete